MVAAALYPKLVCDSAQLLARKGGRLAAGRWRNPTLAAEEELCGCGVGGGEGEGGPEGKGRGVARWRFLRSPGRT